jgi:flagellar biosynthesis protein FlhF
MNVKRFTARSSREALAMIRQALGEDAIVLSTKPSGDGVEVLAMAPESMQQIERMATDGGPAAAPAMSSAAPAAQARAAAPGAARQRPSLASRTAAAMPMPTEALAESSVDDDVARLYMSTLSFQDYVR